MTHAATVQTLDMLWNYFLGPERKSIAEIRGRTRSLMIRRATCATTSQLRHVDRKTVSAADFSDPESERVLDAMADALLGPLALQAARDDDEAEWLASQQGRQ